MTKVLVLGINGMLGHKVFEVLSKESEFLVKGTLRNKIDEDTVIPFNLRKNIIESVVVDQIENVEQVLNQIKPDVVVNCIGVIKQKKEIETKESIKLNALFPHLLSDICERENSRLITISTDCVFDGTRGNYFEDDMPTSHDVYGMTKYLGEVKDKKNTLTLRTSIIGHELNSSMSLVDWFLSQNMEVKGYVNAVFSGFTTLEFSKLLANKIIPNKKLYGLRQISVDPISKYDLLILLVRFYKKEIIITPDNSVEINRSLNSDKFKSEIGYVPPKWDKLVLEMYNDFLESDFYKNKREKYGKTNKF